jgi:hypothetical protein
MSGGVLAPMIEITIYQLTVFWFKLLVDFGTGKTECLPCLFLEPNGLPLTLCLIPYMFPLSGININRYI